MGDCVNRFGHRSQFAKVQDLLTSTTWHASISSGISVRAMVGSSLMQVLWLSIVFW